MRVSNKNGTKAPHKAIMLLSLIELVRNDHIFSHRFRFSVELFNTFTSKWNELVPNDSGFLCNFFVPFYHLQSEPFWNFLDDTGEVLNRIKPTNSVKKLLQKDFLIQIDPTLFYLIRDYQTRQSLSDTLILNYIVPLHS